MYSDMHWDYCHRTLRLSDLKCCKSSHSIPFTDANWSDGTAGLQMILSGPSSFPRKTCRATDSLNGKVTSKKRTKRFRKNTSNYRGWKHPRPPLTRCVALKSCRIYQNPKLKNPGIPGSGTQTKDVSHLNRHKPTLYNLTSDRRVKQRTKEPKSQYVTITSVRVAGDFAPGLTFPKSTSAMPRPVASPAKKTATAASTWSFQGITMEPQIAWSSHGVTNRSDWSSRMKLKKWHKKIGAVPNDSICLMWIQYSNHCESNISFHQPGINVTTTVGILECIFSASSTTCVAGQWEARLLQACY